MKHQGLNNRGEDIVTLDDMREYVEGEVEEIMNIIEGLGQGGNFLPLTGGELTGDLWLHTNKGNYGSRLIFGDKGGSPVPLTYIGEDSDDVLTIKGNYGIKMVVNDGDISLATSNSIVMNADDSFGIKAVESFLLDSPSIGLKGNITPVSNYSFNIGATNIYYIGIYANSIYSGASSNNMNLVGGSNATYGVRFRLSNFASSPAITELGYWNANGLVLNTKLKIGNITIEDGGNGKLLVNGVAIN